MSVPDMSDIEVSPGLNVALSIRATKLHNLAYL